MTRPTRRDASSILQFRKRVPADILDRARGQAIVLRLPGLKREGEIIASGTVGDVVKFSLRTRDPDVARTRTASATAQLEAFFDALRAGPSPLSHKQVVALSGEVYRLYTRQFSEEPGDRADWAALKAVNRAAREGRLFNVPALRPGEVSDSGFASKHFGLDLTAGVNALPASSERQAMELRFGLLVNWALTLHGLSVDEATRTKLLEHVDKAVTDAAWALKRNANGDYTPDMNASRFPKFEGKRPLRLPDLFERWARERGPSASTVTTWRKVVRSLQEHVGHDDVSRITPEDLVRWKDTLVGSALAAKTVKATYLACINTLFGYAVDNRLLPSNPATGITVVIKKRAGTGMLPYSNDEVANLLALSRKQASPARRWLPWLAATTGARIGELAQLWGQRIQVHDDQHVMILAPAEDGGSLKNEESERVVPIHPTLIQDGFLEFVRSRGNGPLFYSRSSRSAVKRHASKGVSNHLATWIWQQGFTDRRKAPNHALRHWWKSAALQAGVADSVADRIQGHAPASDAGVYRHFGISVLYDAIRSIRIPAGSEV